MLYDSDVGKGNSLANNDCLECLIKLAQVTKFGNGFPKRLVNGVIVQNINWITWQMQKILCPNQYAGQLERDGKHKNINKPKTLRTLLQLD